MEKSTKEISDKVADMLGKPRIKFPKPIRTRVDFGALERIQQQLLKDREKGLLK